MASLRNKDGVWYVVWREGGRGCPQKVARAGTDQRAARRLKTLIEARRIEGRVGSGVVLPRITFAAFADRWWAGRTTRPGTMDRERRLLDNHLLPAFGRAVLFDISPDQVAAFGAALRPTAPWTARRAQGLLKTMLQTAKTWGYLHENAAWDVPLPAKPHRELRPPSVADVAEILRAITPAWRALVFVDALTGLRWGELTALEWDDLDLTAGKLHVRRAYDRYAHAVGAPKSAASLGTVDLLPPVRALLLDLPQRSRLVFPAERGGYLNHRAWIRHHWHPVVRRCTCGCAPDAHDARGRCRAEACGCPAYDAPRRGLRFHDLRHFFASLLIAFNEPLSYVQQQLRHDGVDTTYKIYVHLMREARRLDRETTLRVLAEAARPISAAAETGVPRVTPV